MNAVHFGQMIGFGTFSKVYVVKHYTEYYAIKVNSIGHDSGRHDDLALVRKTHQYINLR